MNKQLKTVLFVLVLGVFASALLVGMDVVTADRIEQNKEALLQSAILDGFEEEYTFATINDIFNDTVTVHDIDGHTIYEHNATGRVSFRFEGGGVWGPIIGILTLENDLETIVEITILEQEETPGLGGVVAERTYLDTFVGKRLEISILKGATSLNANQVDAITGATRTSEAFESILNTDYNTIIGAWTAQQE
jgi:Na+-transporting NADH:ubiquinone oxidoreductase subunit C